MRIAVDFDGTIVEDRYPEIGNELPLAVPILKKLQRAGHQLILWTHRAGPELNAAVKYCNENGLEFYSVNKNHPEENISENSSRKIQADLYIDKKNLGGIPSWTEIYWMIYLFIHS